ncbi:hypothetical protein PHYSODRAFT_252465 [Phytophthora sojae]|uniref:Uncharacterized protein n=1 Tax=Phytophthora sojae (strain P6497) TaxID=1094619 RepID=G4YZA2_PHYSP|nr:hypothetical protein PHYSODRAFT_252465 [Phytophthora sojae]EGZ24577.1 hypothetical protein PHYSODRAFT_252465 [Phytophthora sojae]|eukprot:XP_009519865.1 hypothetical protein PHYSODRAFT_252465 [Phytophthora sojae]
MACKWRKNPDPAKYEAKKPKRKQGKKPREFRCACGATFPAKGPRNRHREGCKARDLEDMLRSMTRPGKECDECDRLYSMNDFLYRDRNLILTDDCTIICSDCAEAGDYDPAELEPEILPGEIEEYLVVRRTVDPFPWLKKRRENLCKELVEEMYKPERILKWLESGRDLKAYLN